MGINSFCCMSVKLSKLSVPLLASRWAESKGLWPQVWKGPSGCFAKLSAAESAGDGRGGAPEVWGSSFSGGTLEPRAWCSG